MILVQLESPPRRHYSPTRSRLLAAAAATTDGVLCLKRIAIGIKRLQKMSGDRLILDGRLKSCSLLITFRRPETRYVLSATVFS